MPKKLPDKLPILHDEYHAKHIGRTADGSQFLLTCPFVGASAGDPDSGCEFVALYRFDADGNFLDATIENLGPRARLDGDHAKSVYEQRLADLGEKEFGDICVKPFSLHRFGVEFGLIPRPPDEDDDDWWIILMPGDYMAFTEPWDGDYDT